MKRIVSLLIAVLTVFSLLGAYASYGDGIEVSKCITWIYLPVRPTYVADYYKTGDVPVPPDFSQMKETNYKNPEYETNVYYYVFEGWKQLTTVQEINDYYDNKPGIRYHEPFVQETIKPVENNDLIFGAVFRLVPKKYDINFDKAIDINDIAVELNVLCGQGTSERADVDKDRTVSIRDVTMLLAFMEG